MMTLQLQTISSMSEELLRAVGRLGEIADMLKRVTNSQITSSSALLAMLLGAIALTGCDKSSSKAPAASTEFGVNAPPAAFLHQCLGAAMGGANPVGDLAVEDFVRRLAAVPNANLAWEQGPGEAMILRQTVYDALTKTTAHYAYQFQPGPAAAAPHCGPKLVQLSRIAGDDGEASQAVIYAQLIQVAGLVETARKREASTSGDDEADQGPIIPAAELADMPDPPSPATVNAVVKAARALCHPPQSDEHIYKWDELAEMGKGQIAAYEAAKKRGFQLTPDDQHCYSDARESIAEADENESALTEAGSPSR